MFFNDFAKIKAILFLHHRSTVFYSSLSAPLSAATSSVSAGAGVFAAIRASFTAFSASKAFAAIEGRDFVTPEDIKRATIPVLQHRVIVTPEREMEGLTSQQIIEQIIEAVEIPR